MIVLSTDLPQIQKNKDPKTKKKSNDFNDLHQVVESVVVVDYSSEA